MWIDIVVLPVGEPPIASWRYKRTSSREFVVLDQLTGERYSPIDAWKRLSSEINRRSALQPHNGLDVFLKWRFPLVNDLVDLQAWTTLIDDAQNYSWGGRVYLTWNKSELDFDQNCTGEALENWLATIVNSGLTSLIELQGNELVKDDENSYFTFATAAQASRSRHKQLRDFVSDAGWIAIFRGGEAIEVVVAELVKKGVLPADSKNEIIVYEREPTRNDLRNLSRRSRWDNRKGDAFRADVTGKRLQLGPGMPTVHFNGVFEWLHAFIQLNQTRKLSRRKPVVRNDARVVWLDAPVGLGVFTKKKKKDRRLLVTSGISPEQVDDGAAAAKEIGACLRQLTFDVDVEVHPCVSCEMLPDLLASREFTAWLHISHGKQGFGLKEAFSPTFASAERWKHCFDAFQGRLQLVMLSACESAEIAHELKKRGISVAVGFEKDVYVRAARLVSERVIPAAFERRQPQRAILDAFQLACRELESRSYIEDGKVRYYIDCSPRAFASRKPS